MADAVISVTLENIICLLQNEASSLFRIPGLVEAAKTELEMLRSFLKDASNCGRSSDQRTQTWIAGIREATYDLEDVVAGVAAREDLEVPTGLRFLKSVLTTKLAFVLGNQARKAGLEIEEITKRLSALRSSLQSVGMRELRDESLSFLGERRQELRRSYSHVVEHDVVGLDGDIAKLALQLTNGGGPRVVSIHGMGGVGKTTLARKVYHHHTVRSHFHSFAWASVTHQFQARDIWEGILARLDSSASRDGRKMRDDEVAKRLYELQKETSCLVVLDDVWTVDAWDRLTPAFPEDGAISKILLTTRIKDVALHCDTRGSIHEPMLLSKQEMWELLKRKAYFGINMTNSEDNRKMESLGSEMLDHCYGLPLAVVVLGGLLSTRHTVDEWERLLKHVKAYIRKGNIHQHEDLEHRGVSWVLGLSYDDLPYHLKLCFLHFAYFPEDFEIKVKDICRIWMAEGIFPLNQHGESSSDEMEDFAYECFCELLQRCMVQEGELDLTGRFKTCHIHDLMRDLCLLKAKEENSLRVAHFNGRDAKADRMFSNSHKVRRLAVYLEGTNSNNNLLSLVENIDDCLRLFICFNWELSCYERVMTPLFSRFRALRVLKFENLVSSNALKIMKIPKEIGDLILLRLLSLRDTLVESLPSAIGNLRNLQTLDLRVKTFKSPIISNMMWKLVRLRHLYLPNDYSLTGNKLRLDTLRNLRTLVNVSTKYCILNHLVQLTNLIKLKIYVTTKFERSFSNPASIGANQLTCLQSLNIVNSCEGTNPVPLIARCPQIYKLRVRGEMAELPEINRLSSSLIKLTLQETKLTENPMPKLGKLPNLRILKFGRMAFEGTAIVCSSGDFPKLDSLSLSSLRSFEEWKVEKGTLQKLTLLHIDDCPLLRGVPDGLTHVTTLKEFTIQRMSLKFKQKVLESDFLQSVKCVFSNTLDIN